MNQFNLQTTVFIGQNSYNILSIYNRQDALSLTESIIVAEPSSKVGEYVTFFLINGAWFLVKPNFTKQLFIDPESTLENLIFW